MSLLGAGDMEGIGQMMGHILNETVQEEGKWDEVAEDELRNESYVDLSENKNISK